MFAVFKHLYAVYENMDHTRCILVRFFERRVVDDCVGVENDNVCVESFFKFSPAVEFEVFRRK
jgi:hypothetical protein